MSTFFEEYFQHVGTLRHEVPILNEALSEPVDLTRMPGWSEMENQPRERVLFNGRPALVATTFGPSGSGKSTFFSMLTGVEVPRGVERPTTYQSLAVMPESLVPNATCLFPDFRTEELPNGDIETLKRKAPSDPALLYVNGMGGGHDSQTSLILADVPDFTTVEKDNWTKAERLLARAEVVLFLVYPESYNDNRVIELLLRCCRSKVKLVYIHNKCGDGSRKPADLAEELWTLLVTKTVEQDSRFAEKREDGRTLAEFLKCAPVYYCPSSPAPTLQQVQPLSENTPDLHSLLYGMDGSRIVQESLLQISDLVGSAVDGLCNKAEQEERELASKVADVDEAIHECATLVAGTEFPAGRMLELIIDAVRESRPRWQNRLSVPLSWVAKKLIRGYRAAVGRLKARRGTIDASRRLLDEQERERLGADLSKVIDRCRANSHPAADTAYDTCSRMEHEFLEREVPPIGETWETTVIEGARTWVKENPVRANAVGAFSDALPILGVGAMVIDIFVGGGFATLGIVSTGLAVPSSAAGVVLKVCEEWKLGTVLRKADEEWRRCRTETIACHIRTHLAEPLLLGELDRRRQALAGEALTNCREACEGLRALVDHDGGNQEATP